MNSASSPGTGANLTGFPIGLGSVDAVGRGGDEVPPDVPRTIHRFAAEQHQPRIRVREDRNAVAGLEHEQPAGTKRLSCYVDFARDDVDRALVVVGVQRQHGSRRQHGLGVEAFVRKCDRRYLAEHSAHHQAHSLAVTVDPRQFANIVVCKCRCGFLVRRRQRRPGLDAEDLAAACCGPPAACARSGRCHGPPSSSSRRRA